MDFDTWFRVPEQSDLKITSKRVWSYHRKAPKGHHRKAPLHVPVTFVYCSFNTCSPGGRQREFIKKLGPRPRTIDVLQTLKSLQSLDFRKYQHEIRYNFMIGGDGVVYEGRGWKDRPSLPQKHFYNMNNSFYIGFIGNWQDEPPDQKLFELRDEVIKMGIQKKVIQEKFLLVTLAFPSVYKLDFDYYIK